MSTYALELNHVVENLDDNQIIKLIDYAKKMIASVKKADSVVVQKKHRYGILNGIYNIPDNIDDINDEIAEMFGV